MEAISGFIVFMIVAMPILIIVFSPFIIIGVLIIALAAAILKDVMK